MFNLKLWIAPFLLLITGALLVVLGSPLLYEELVPTYDGEADALVQGVNGLMRSDSERSITAASLLTADPAVRDFLKKPSEQVPAALKEGLLAVESSQLGRPDFAVVVDKAGTIILESGAKPGLPPDAQGLPWVRDGLTGQMGDALHRDAEGRPYHLAMAPVIDNNVPIGVVALGWSLSDAYVERIAKRMSAVVILLDGTKPPVLGKSTLDDETIQAMRKNDAGGAVDIGIPIPNIPLLVPNDGRYVARPVKVYGGDDSMKFMVVVDRNAAFKTLAWGQIGTVGVTFLLILLLSFLIMSIQKSIRRPMQIITQHLSQYAQGTASGVIPEAGLSGPFVRLAKQINMILQAPTPGSAPRPGTSPITNPSGVPALSLPPTSSAVMPVPQDDGPLTFDGIPGLGDGPATSPPVSAPPVPVAAAPASAAPPPAPAEPIAPVNAAPVSDDLASSALAGLFDDGADPLAAFRVDKGPPAAPTEPLPGGPPPPPPVTSPGEGEGYNPEATVMFQVPDELIQESAQVSAGSSAPIGPPPSTAPEPPEDRTVIAQVPPELLSKGAPKLDLAEQEQAHYQQVYQDFIRTRQECGEDTSDLTFDRFVGKLMKNRQAIMEKYKCRSVRFQVYVKGDKAALRAVPVRE